MGSWESPALLPTAQMGDRELEEEGLPGPRCWSWEKGCDQDSPSQAAEAGAPPAEAVV